MTEKRPAPHESGWDWENEFPYEKNEEVEYCEKRGSITTGCYPARITKFKSVKKNKKGVIVKCRIYLKVSYPDESSPGWMKKVKIKNRIVRYPKAFLAYIK